jgi:hypothetical protein
MNRNLTLKISLIWITIRPSGVIQFRINSLGATPWNGDRLITKPVPIQDNTNTEKLPCSAELKNDGAILPLSHMSSWNSV